MLVHTETLPDGRVVELLDMTLGDRVGDLWTIDVHLRVGEQLVTKRVEIIWDEDGDTPPVGVQLASTIADATQQLDNPA